MTRNTYLGMKLLKNAFSKLFATISKALRKSKISSNFSSEEISWPNFMEGYNNLSPDIGAKSLLIGL